MAEINEKILSNDDKKESSEILAKNSEDEAQKEIGIKSSLVEIQLVSHDSSTTKDNLGSPSKTSVISSSNSKRNDYSKSRAKRGRYRSYDEINKDLQETHDIFKTIYKNYSSAFPPSQTNLSQTLKEDLVVPNEASQISDKGKDYILTYLGKLNQTLVQMEKDCANFEENTNQNVEKASLESDLKSGRIKNKYNFFNPTKEQNTSNKKTFTQYFKNIYHNRILRASKSQSTTEFTQTPEEIYTELELASKKHITKIFKKIYKDHLVNHTSNQSDQVHNLHLTEEADYELTNAEMLSDIFSLIYEESIFHSSGNAHKISPPPKNVKLDQNFETPSKKRSIPQIFKQIYKDSIYKPSLILDFDEANEKVLKQLESSSKENVRQIFKDVYKESFYTPDESANANIYETLGKFNKKLITESKESIYKFFRNIYRDRSSSAKATAKNGHDKVRDEESVSSYDHASAQPDSLQMSSEKIQAQKDDKIDLIADLISWNQIFNI